MNRVDENEAQKRAEEKPERPVDLFDPWAKKLAFDRPYRLPKLPDLSEDLTGTVH